MTIIKFHLAFIFLYHKNIVVWSFNFSVGRSIINLVIIPLKICICFPLATLKGLPLVLHSFIIMYLGVVVFVYILLRVYCNSWICGIMSFIGVLGLATITKYYRLGCININLFLTVLEAVKYKIKVPANLILGEGILSGFQNLLSPHTVVRKRALFSFSSSKDTNPIIGFPRSRPHLNPITFQRPHPQYHHTVCEGFNEYRQDTSLTCFWS